MKFYAGAYFYETLCMKINWNLDRAPLSSACTVELSHLSCALAYRFIFSSETDYMTQGESEKTGAIFSVMVG